MPHVLDLFSSSSIFFSLPFMTRRHVFRVGYWIILLVFATLHFFLVWLDSKNACHVQKWAQENYQIALWSYFFVVCSNASFLLLVKYGHRCRTWNVRSISKLKKRLQKITDNMKCTVVSNCLRPLVKMLLFSFTFQFNTTTFEYNNFNNLIESKINIYMNFRIL